MDKQEIQDVIEKISAKEPVKIQMALGFVGFSYGLMTAGIAFWFLFFSSGMIFSKENIILLSLAGSSLVGVTIFFYSIGAYYYFILHNKHLPIHWFLQGLMRTIIQFYYFGSIILLFILTQYIFPQIGSEFLFLYLLFFLPIYIGYMLPRWGKIKNLIEINFFEKLSN